MIKDSIIVELNKALPTFSSKYAAKSAKIQTKKLPFCVINKFNNLDFSKNKIINLSLLVYMPFVKKSFLRRFYEFCYNRFIYPFTKKQWKSNLDYEIDKFVDFLISREFKDSINHFYFSFKYKAVSNCFYSKDLKANFKVVDFNVSCRQQGLRRKNAKLRKGSSIRGNKRGRSID